MKVYEFRFYNKEHKEIDYKPFLGRLDFYFDNLNNFKPMLFIEQFDIDGTKIFEKDILMDSKGIKYLVDYDDSDCTFTFTALDGLHKGEKYWFDVLEGLKVIGNYYESTKILNLLEE